MSKLRARATAGLDGEVLEIGFGSGLNVPVYPSKVSRVRAVDPSVTGRKLASKRVAASPVPIEYIGRNGEQVPLEDASVDHVLTTWTLCTIPDVSRAMDEIHRVLRPGGEMHFLEHGRAPDWEVARWQDRLTPIQRLVAGGCHLNRRIDELITDAGLYITRLDNFFVAGPRAFSYMYQGVASKSSS